MTRRLSLVRHAVTRWTLAGRITGWTDVPLNAVGRAQAAQLGERLAARSFDSVWCSDLCRATQTATIAVGLGRADPRLRELDFGRLEGLTWDACPPGLRRDLVAFDDFRAPGGESVGDLRRRVLDVIAGLPSGDHLLITHGGVIRTLLRWTGRDGAVAPGELIELTVER